MMRAPPLCIIQARLASTRLPNKMLLRLGDESIIARAHRLACEAFYPANVVVGIPKLDVGGPLDEELQRIGATVYAPDCDQSDVLTRFFMIAHHRRWHPDSVIVRWTPDDPFKEPALCRRVAAGERLPVEQGAEAFTLAMLSLAYSTADTPFNREHITHALFGVIQAPTAPTGQVWTLDTPEDFNAITKRWRASHERVVW